MRAIIKTTDFLYVVAKCASRAASRGASLLRFADARDHQNNRFSVRRSQVRIPRRQPGASLLGSS